MPPTSLLETISISHPMDWLSLKNGNSRVYSLDCQAGAVILFPYATSVQESSQYITVTDITLYGRAGKRVTVSQTGVYAITVDMLPV